MTEESGTHAPFLSPMTNNPLSLGHCPTCNREISQAWKLIEYERADGDIGVFAECPTCDEVIKPQENKNKGD
ncbi:hypothetical protein EXE43_18260 [Halorubrum sp. SS5]|nr:hypothetical protein EXE44_11860 [Halorubrum sp. SS7]TKX84556.1 hypothetical protein EXE43_18260 [Halorubrum sp. SS5]